MSIRKTTLNFFQNLADYLTPVQEPLLVPDFSVSHIPDMWNYNAGPKPKDRGMEHYSDDEAHQVIAKEQRAERIQLNKMG